jgi:hypothetical protein
MTPFEASGLLQEIVTFAQEILCRPLGDLTVRRQRCEALQGRLEAAIAESRGEGHLLDNGAPALLHAIDRVLYRRHCYDEAGAAVWEGVIGHLMPIARTDSGAILARAHDNTPERATR